MLKLSFRISIITDSAAKFGFLRRFSSIPKRRFKVLDGRIDIPSGQKEQLEEQKNSYVEKYQRKYQQVMEGLLYYYYIFQKVVIAQIEFSFRVTEQCYNLIESNRANLAMSNRLISGKTPVQIAMAKC